MPSSSNALATPLLQAHQLACERGGALLFKGLTLSLPPGELLWLRGRNGQGKTTLLRCLAGLVEHAQGQVLWQGQSLREASSAGRQGLLYVGHANALKDDLSLAEVLQFSAQVRGAQASQVQVESALAEVGLPGLAHRHVRGLSQGQRRRVALARLVLAQAQPECKLWLLDEPFDALDDEGVQRLAQLLLAFAKGGGAVLFTSHLEVPALQSSAAQLADAARPLLRHLDLSQFAAGRAQVATDAVVGSA